MKVTFIIKNMSTVFYEGNGGSIPGINNLSDLERLDKLFKCASLPEYEITSKIGKGSFRDKVDLNHLKSQGWKVAAYKLENRKGYKLATFEIM